MADRQVNVRVRVEGDTTGLQSALDDAAGKVDQLQARLTALSRPLPAPVIPAPRIPPVRIPLPQVSAPVVPPPVVPAVPPMPAPRVGRPVVPPPQPPPTPAAPAPQAGRPAAPAAPAAPAPAAPPPAPPAEAGAPEPGPPPAAPARRGRGQSPVPGWSAEEVERVKAMSPAGREALAGALRAEIARRQAQAGGAPEPPPPAPEPARPKIAPKAPPDAAKVQAAVQRLKGLYDRVTEPDVTHGVIESAVSDVATSHSLDELKEIARGLGRRQSVMSRPDFARQVTGQFSERRGRHERGEEIARIAREGAPTPPPVPAEPPPEPPPAPETPAPETPAPKRQRKAAAPPGPAGELPAHVREAAGRFKDLAAAAVADPGKGYEAIDEALAELSKLGPDELRSVAGGAGFAHEARYAASGAALRRAIRQSLAERKSSMERMGDRSGRPGPEEVAAQAARVRADFERPPEPEEPPGPESPAPVVVPPAPPAGRKPPARPKRPAPDVAAAAESIRRVGESATSLELGRGERFEAGVDALVAELERMRAEDLKAAAKQAGMTLAGGKQAMLGEVRARLRARRGSYAGTQFLGTQFRPGEPAGAPEAELWPAPPPAGGMGFRAAGGFAPDAPALPAAGGRVFTPEPGPPPPPRRPGVQGRREKVGEDFTGPGNGTSGGGLPVGQAFWGGGGVPGPPMPSWDEITAPIAALAARVTAWAGAGTSAVRGLQLPAVPAGRRLWQLPGIFTPPAWGRTGAGGVAPPGPAPPGAQPPPGPFGPAAQGPQSWRPAQGGGAVAGAIGIAQGVAGMAVPVYGEAMAAVGILQAAVKDLPAVSDQLGGSFAMLSREIGIVAIPAVVQLSGALQAASKLVKGVDEKTGGFLSELGASIFSFGAVGELFGLPGSKKNPWDQELLVPPQGQTGGDVQGLYDRIMMTQTGAAPSEIAQQAEAYRRLVEALNANTAAVNAVNPPPEI